MNIYVIPQGWHKQPMLVSLEARLALAAHHHSAHEFDVARTELYTFRQRQINVSTILLPVATVSHLPAQSALRIEWKTMVFGPHTAVDLSQWRWRSRAEAVRGHRWALRHTSLMLALLYGDSIVKISHRPLAIESGDAYVWRKHGMQGMQGSEPQEMQKGDLV